MYFSKVRYSCRSLEGALPERWWGLSVGLASAIPHQRRMDGTANVDSNAFHF